MNKFSFEKEKTKIETQQMIYLLMLFLGIELFFSIFFYITINFVSFYFLITCEFFNGMEWSYASFHSIVFFVSCDENGLIRTIYELVKLFKCLFYLEFKFIDCLVLNCCKETFLSVVDNH